MGKNVKRTPPTSYFVGQELNWNAPWVTVTLWAELPFWLMMDNGRIVVNVAGHPFKIEVHDNYWELHVGEVTDSRSWVCYQGPFRKSDHLSAEIQQFKKDRPSVPII